MTNIALILTTYHSLERIPMYKERIIWWLDNSKLDLFIVDSNNSNFDYLPEKYLNNKQVQTCMNIWKKLKLAINQLNLFKLV